MTYWHMQMNQPYGSKKGFISSKDMLNEVPTPVIGTGEWDDIQCRYFKGKTFDNRGMDVGDIVMIREGVKPIALCEVISDYFADKALTKKYAHQNFRKVKILSLYEGTERFNKAEGTLERLINKSTDSWLFINNWFQEILQNKPMQNYISILNQKPQIILQGAPGTGKTRLAEDLAYHMIFEKTLPTEKAERDKALKKLYNSEQFALVQFHPAYSYEDFVRGIVAETKNNAISYEVKNKILVEMAEKANKNLLDSQKEIDELRKELQIEEHLEQFKEYIQNEIEQNSIFPINEAVHIEAVGLEGFAYTGNNWTNTLNMKYKDLLLFHHVSVTERKMIKNLKEASGTAINHASYYFKLFQKFQEFIKQNKVVPNVTITERTKVKNYILIIDEINRANLPAVLGELIYALEYRDKPVNGLYELDGDRQITLPKNLYIIGTMNTADRSVGHIDYAIRRRFAFATVPPDESAIKNQKAKNLFSKIKAIFKEKLSSDFEEDDIMIGHSYFLVEKDEELETRLTYEIKPLLREYVKDGILTCKKEDIENL